MRTEEEITKIYLRNRQLLYKICFLHMKNASDAEDILSDTFCKLIDKSPRFVDTEHEKAWLIRVATNLCKNALKKKGRNHADLDDYSETLTKEEVGFAVENEVIQEILELPDKYKTVLILHYYEGYQSEEISHMIRKPASTVRNYLSKARVMLKERLGNEYE